MESSPASAEVKGSTQAEERETERRGRQKRVERKRWASESDNNKRRRACRTGHLSPENTQVGLGRGGVEEGASYLPTLPLEALLSLTAWRAGKSTAGQKGHSPSSLHCRQRERKNCFLTPPFNVQAQKRQQSCNIQNSYFCYQFNCQLISKLS